MAKTQLRMVAALYVETDGVYFNRVGVDPWDEARDAKKYKGPWPVVAHPPCGPWGPMWKLATKQDPSCGPRAVEQVRRFGGVLEHPANSKLFARMKMPMPGESPDDFWGVTYVVDQVAWGHACLKRTWLYVVGVPKKKVVAGLRFGGVATHKLRARHNGAGADEGLLMASKEIRSRTPPAFADFLISLARQARR